MAEILDINQMFANEYEPKRAFRWTLEIDGIDSFTAKTTMRPKKDHEVITIDWMNEKRFLAGKATWAPISIELYDPIAPSQCVKVMEWLKLIHDDSTGRMGYASMYKKNFFLKIMDGGGLVVEKWQAVGGFPKNIELGTLDYSNNEALVAKFECQADKWKLIY
jgi:hypothetical protein